MAEISGGEELIQWPLILVPEGLAETQGVDLFWEEPEGRTRGGRPERLVWPHKINYLIFTAAL